MGIRKLVAILILILAVLIAGCAKEPVCGDGFVDDGEDWNNCCKDVGCLGDQSCVNNTCMEPECGECKYLDEREHICKDYTCCKDSDCPEGETCSKHKCKKIECEECQYFDDETSECVDYECCEDSDCKSNEECSNNECKEIKCASCQYFDEDKKECIDYECCKDSDCDDDDDETLDKCESPKTKSSDCIHQDIKTCTADEDCDDDDDSTTDVCLFGTPVRCVNFEITDCKDGDDYCPSGCTYSSDDDCEIEEIECDNDDVDCFTDALEDCEQADITYTSLDDDRDIEIEGTTYFKIEGENSKDECEVFIETKKLVIDFTNDYKDELKDDGYGASEIADMEDEEQEDADKREGDEWTCYFDDTTDLKDMLDDWDDDKYDISDLDSFDCQADVIECDDDDLDCFTDALDNCNLAELTIIFMMDDDDVDVEFKTNLEVKGENNDDECEVYFETDRVDVDFTNSYKNELEDEGYSSSEINDLEDDTQEDADDLEDQDWTCAFEDPEDAIVILEDWEDDEYTTNDLNGYDCDDSYDDLDLSGLPNK